MSQEIQAFNSKVEQDYWLRKMSERMNISEQALHDDFQQFVFSSKQQSNQEKDNQSDDNRVVKKDRAEMLGEELIGFLLKYPPQMEEWLKLISPNLFSGKLFELVKEIKLYYDKNDSFNYHKFYQKIKTAHSSLAEYCDVLTLLIEKDFSDLKIFAFEKKTKTEQQSDEMSVIYLAPEN